MARMTKQEMRLAIAKGFGWIDIDPLWQGWLLCFTGYEGPFDVPNYPEDLNACKEFEDILTGKEYERYAKLLASDCETDKTEVMDYHLIKIGKASAEQRCLAYLALKKLIYESNSNQVS